MQPEKPDLADRAAAAWVALVAAVPTAWLLWWAINLTWAWAGDDSAPSFIWVGVFIAVAVGHAFLWPYQSARLFGGIWRWLVRLFSW